MNCSHVEDKLDFYLDGELPTGRINKLERHLEDCVDCRKLLEERKRLNTIISSSDPIPPVPDGFVEKTVTRANFGAARQRPTPLFRLAVAASLLLGLLVGLLGSRQLVLQFEREAIAEEETLMAGEFFGLQEPEDDPLAVYYFSLSEDNNQGVEE